jgi:putative addiction module killer protein
MAALEIRQYQTGDGRIPVADWLDNLRDRAARLRVLARMDRLTEGLRGDWKSLGGGIYELRVDYGPGYRVYYAQDGTVVILLLCGGTKRTQANDIEKARAYWKDYKTRSA